MVDALVCRAQGQRAPIDARSSVRSSPCGGASYARMRMGCAPPPVLAWIVPACREVLTQDAICRLRANRSGVR